MTILSKADFSGAYLTSNGTWPDNSVGEITAEDLRNGIQDFFDSQTSNWYADTSGIIASDGSGLIGVDFKNDEIAPAHREGRVFYDSENKTFAIYNDIPDVTLQLGQEMFVRCVNKTADSTTITNGTAVRITGSQGQRPKVDRSIASSDIWYLAEGTIGLSTHDIANNKEGIITTEGIVRGLKTDYPGWYDGASLFLSPTVSGDLTVTFPSAPEHIVWMGVVLNTHPTEGSIYVKPRPVPRITALSDVNGTTPQEGYILAYNTASGYWDPTNQINTSGGFTFGTDTNYSKFEEDTGFQMSAGSGRAWDDLRFPFTGQRLDTSAGRIDYNFTENTVDFQDNATSNDQVNIIAQMQHEYAADTNVHPHIHWIQNQDADPAWRMDYRHYPNGGQVPAWTTGVAPLTAREFTYTSGNMLQITEFPIISGSALSGYGVSWFMDIKIYRVSASDSYSGDASAKEFDLHYIRDTRGSRQEYIK